MIMKIRYSFERGAIDVSRLRVITLRFSNFIFIFLRHFYDEKFYNVNILRIFIYLQDKRFVGEFAIIIFSRVICKFASENVAKKNGMIDEKIRTRDRQSFSVYRRVLAVKWPMSFIGAIKGSLIRNETLKENLTIIPH